jgi:hypothetical protein
LHCRKGRVIQNSKTISNAFFRYLAEFGVKIHFKID